MITVENNENRSVCARCGGKCCKRIPGIYAPEQFGAPDKKELVIQIYAALLGGKAQVDWYEGDPREVKCRINPKRVRSGLYIRPTIKGHDGEIEYGAWVGECAMLTDAGCSLSFQERPIVCQMLIPCEENPDRGCQLNHPQGNNWDERRDSAIAWIPYHRQIRAAIKMVEKERSKNAPPLSSAPPIWCESDGEDVTKPRIAIGSGTRNKGEGCFGEFHINWQEGYLESLPDGVVNLASTESKGVRYRFCVERVKEGE